MIEATWIVVLRRILRQCLSSPRNSAISNAGKHYRIIEMEHGGTHPLYSPSSGTQESHAEDLSQETIAMEEKSYIPQECSP